MLSIAQPYCLWSFSGLLVYSHFTTYHKLSICIPSAHNILNHGLSFQLLTVPPTYNFKIQINDEILGLVFFYLFIIGLEALRRQPVSANESGFIATIKRIESSIVSVIGISYLPYLLHNSIVGVYSFLGSIPWFYVFQAARSLAIAWTTIRTLRNVEQMPAYKQEEEDNQEDGTKDEASNGELKPSWDSNANHAWSCDN